MKFSLDTDGNIISLGIKGDYDFNSSDLPFTITTFQDWKWNSTDEIWEEIIMVPEVISKLQATKHMLNIGRHDELMAIIDADITGETRLLYDASYQLYRNSGMVNQLGAAMGYDSDGLDNLFIEANKILL